MRRWLPGSPPGPHTSASAAPGERRGPPPAAQPAAAATGVGGKRAPRSLRRLRQQPGRGPRCLGSMKYSGGLHSRINYLSIYNLKDVCPAANKDSTLDSKSRRAPRPPGSPCGRLYPAEWGAGGWGASSPRLAYGSEQRSRPCRLSFSMGSRVHVPVPPPPGWPGRQRGFVGPQA